MKILFLILVLLRNSFSESAPESDQVLQINQRLPHQVVEINPSLPRVTFQITPSKQTFHGSLFGNLKNKEYPLQHGQIVFQRTATENLRPQVQNVGHQSLPNLEPNYKWIKIESDVDRHQEFKQPSDIVKNANSNSEDNQKFEKHFEIRQSSESFLEKENAPLNTVTHDKSPENKIQLPIKITNLRRIPLSGQVLRLTTEEGQQNYPTNYQYGNRYEAEQQLHQIKEIFDGPVVLISKQPSSAAKFNPIAGTLQNLMQNRQKINVVRYVPEKLTYDEQNQFPLNMVLENIQKSKKVPVVSSSFEDPERASSQQDFMDLQSVLQSLLYAVGGHEKLNRSHFNLEHSVKINRNETQLLSLSEGLKESENHPQNTIKRQFGNIMGTVDQPKPFPANSQDSINIQSTVEQSQFVSQNVSSKNSLINQPYLKNAQESVMTLQKTDLANRPIRIKTSAADLYITRKPCEICCKEGEMEPCSTCCYVTPLLNVKTLKTSVG